MRNLLNNNIFIGTIIFLCVVGCRKDPHLAEEEIPTSGCVEPWCDEFPEPPEIGFEYTSEGVQYLAPCFNPNNSNEFVYIRRGQSINPELVKYDLTTNQETILLDPMSLGRPDWGRQGWITFVYTLKHIWKIYDNGSQLTQLTAGEDDKFPSFNYSGDKIYYYRNKWYSNFELEANPDLAKNYKMMLLDLNGVLLDSITVASPVNDYNAYFTHLTWSEAAFSASDDIYFVNGANNFTWIFQLKNNAVTKVKAWSSPQSIEDIDTYSTNIYYTKYRKGIFKLDINTGQETKLKWGCESRHYASISISNDGQKMLVQKVISKPYNNNQSIDEQNEIWLLDVNGCAEQKILGD